MNPFDELAGHFRRIVTGYAAALDDSGVRAWIDGHHNLFDAGGAWISSTRIAPALAAWLSQPGRPSEVEWQGRTADVPELLGWILERGCDPAAPGSWPIGAAGPVDQKTVESSVLAYAAWLASDTVLPKVDTAALAEWLDYFGSADPLGSNWSLFWVVNHAARKALGWRHDQAKIDAGLDIVDGLHRGGGWMTDGAEGRFDDYNWWVFGSHELMWAQLDGASGGDPARRDHVVNRVRERLGDYPYFFGADGSYAEYGRSLSYTFARLACPVLAYSLGAWPHSVGMLQAIVRRHLRLAVDNGPVDASGIVRQTLTPTGTADVRDRYIDTGHPYWSTMAFAALWQLPDDDPFWTADEEPLPVESGDFRRTIHAPGWVVAGVQESGQVLRYSLGSSDGGAKYGKFVYGSHAPVDFGLVDGDPGPDAALCVEDETGWAHCGGYSDCEAGDGWLRALHEFQLGGRVVPCETTLFVLGETWLTHHRLTLPSDGPALRFVEGGAAFGFEAGAVPAKRVDAVARLSEARLGPAASAIVGIEGWDRALPPQGFRGDDTRNGRSAHSVTPLVEARREADGAELTLVAAARTTRSAISTAPPAVEIADAGMVSAFLRHVPWLA